MYKNRKLLLVKQHLFPYQAFTNYCLRNPLLPFSFYDKLTQNTEVSLQQLQQVWKNKVIQEALLLASPNLFQEIEKLINNKLNDTSKKEKVSLAFLKYISRMSSRCTPFGLFAGCSIGSFGTKTKINLTNYRDFHRKTRFDMNFLVAFAMYLANKSEIKKQLLFYPNSSLYKAGAHLRYIEYTYYKNRRIHSIEAVSDTDYLNTILEAANSGKKLDDLALFLVSDNITIEEATAFIEELVANQILVSELEPSVSGKSFLEQITTSLEKLTKTKEITSVLNAFTKQLNTMDKQLGNSSKIYFNFMDRLKKMEATFEKNYIFQTDLFTKTTANTLSENTLENLKKGLLLLNKITLKNKQTNLNNFKKSFVKRYEQQEIPLTLALDIEMGIGYIQTSNIADDNPILDDLRLPAKKEETTQKYWNGIHKILQKKLLESFKNNAYSISLSDTDFEGFEADWSDLPDTISTIAEVVLVNAQEMVSLSSIGGSSAANLLGRFASGNTEILKHTKNIIAKEKELQNTKILAEIVHLPQARTGNVLMRPTFRDFEIPYLAKSTLAKENQIAITDLLISVRGNKIRLRSKKHNKEVLPHLTNAHNFSNSLPIYHFLCDMQTQNLRSSLYFSWGNAFTNHHFTPRVVYKNVIFAKATWFITKASIALFSKEANTNVLLKKVQKWRLKLQIPKYVQLVEADNTLVINLENSTSIRMLLDSVKRKKQFLLEEFLFADNGIVNSGNDYYTNQVVFSFFKEKR